MLISFPFNLKGQTKASITFDFMRGGKHLYSALWDAQTMIGPEQTILNSKDEPDALTICMTVKCQLELHATYLVFQFTSHRAENILGSEKHSVKAIP